MCSLHSVQQNLYKRLTIICRQRRNLCGTQRGRTHVKNLLRSSRTPQMNSPPLILIMTSFYILHFLIHMFAGSRYNSFLFSYYYLFFVNIHSKMRRLNFVPWAFSSSKLRGNGGKGGLGWNVFLLLESALHCVWRKKASPFCMTRFAIDYANCNCVMRICVPNSKVFVQRGKICHSKSNFCYVALYSILTPFWKHISYPLTP